MEDEKEKNGWSKCWWKFRGAVDDSMAAGTASKEVEGVVGGLEAAIISADTCGQCVSNREERERGLLISFSRSSVSRSVGQSFSRSAGQLVNRSHTPLVISWI